MNRSAGWLIAALISSVAAADPPATQPESYRINLTPPTKVGEKLDYIAYERESASGTTSDIELDAIVDVKACDAKNRPSQMDVHVKHLAFVDKQSENILEPGSVVTARRAVTQNDPPASVDTFSLRDATLTPFQSIAMRRVVTVGDEKEPTEQEAFGPDKRLPIGGTWSLDGESGTKLLARMRIVADPKRVKGAGKLVEKFKRDGVECLYVKLTVQCDRCLQSLPFVQTPVNVAANGMLELTIAKDTGQVINAR